MSLKSRARSIAKKLNIKHQAALALLRSLGARPAQVAREFNWPLTRADAFVVDPQLDPEYAQVSAAGHPVQSRVCSACSRTYFFARDGGGSVVAGSPERCPGCQAGAGELGALEGGSPSSDGPRVTGMGAAVRQALVVSSVVEKLRGMERAVRPVQELAERVRTVLRPFEEAAAGAAAAVQPFETVAERARAALRPLDEAAGRVRAALQPVEDATALARTAQRPFEEAAERARAVLRPLDEAAERARGVLRPFEDAGARARGVLAPVAEATEVVRAAVGRFEQAPALRAMERATKSLSMPPALARLERLGKRF